MSQFVFLQREWPAVSDAASKAEAAVHTDRRKQPMRVPEWAERCRLEAAQPTSDFDQAVAEKYPRLLAELEECFGEGERLMAVVRERLNGVGDAG